MESHLQYVTAFFCDFVASTSSIGEFPPDVWAECMEEYFRCASLAVEANGGVVEKFIGDAICGVFGMDGRSETAADGAFRAAVSVLNLVPARLAEHGLSIRGAQLRVGIASGYVAVSRRASTFAIGPALNLASRIQSIGPAQSISLDDDTWQLVRCAGGLVSSAVYPLKGIPAGVKVWTVENPVFHVEPLGDAQPLVGRIDDVARVAQFVDGVWEGGADSLTVVGAAGIGKTRIVREALSSGVRGARVLQIDGKGWSGVGSLLPCYELLQALVQAEGACVGFRSRLNSARTEIEAVVGHSLEDVWTEIREALARWVGELPLIVVVDGADDLPPCLEVLFDQLTVFAKGCPGFRFIQVRRALAGEETNVLTVQELSREDSGALALLCAGPDVEFKSLNGVFGLCGGNPMMIEQVVGRLSSGESLGRIPASIHALLGDRLSALGESAGQVLALTCAGGGEIPVSVGREVLGSETVRVGLEELRAAAMLDGTALIEDCICPVPGAVMEVMESRLSRAALRDLHIRLAEYWRTLSLRRPAVIDLEATHWLLALDVEKQAGYRIQANEGRWEAALGAIVSATKLAISRGDTQRARELLDSAGKYQWSGCSAAAIDALRVVSLGYGGEFEQAAALLESLSGRDADRDTRGVVAWCRAILSGDFVSRGSRNEFTAAVSAGDQQAAAVWGLVAGIGLMNQGEFLSAGALFADSLRCCKKTVHGLCEVELRANLGLSLVYGSLPAQEVLRECSSLADGAEHSRLLRAVTGGALAMAKHLAGDIAGAHAWLWETYSSCSSMGIRSGCSDLLGMRAWMAAREGSWGYAAECWENQRRLCEEMGYLVGAEQAKVLALASRWPAQEAFDRALLKRGDHFSARAVALLGDCLPYPAATLAGSLEDSLFECVRHISSSSSAGAGLEVLLLAERICSLGGFLEVGAAARARLRAGIQLRGDRGIRLRGEVDE